MRNYQSFIMLLLTLAVGLLFVVRTSTPQDQEIANLEATITVQQATLDFWESQPTPPPASPTPFPTDTPDLPLTGGNNAPVVLATLPPSGANPVLVPTFAPTGSRILNIQSSLQVDAQGCAINPATTFNAAQSIYGVVNLAEVQVGDQLGVEFFYEEGNLLIYEDSFTIQEGGSFCRWYIVEPDADGWDNGTYRITYTLNGNPTIVTYQVAGG